MRFIIVLLLYVSVSACSNGVSQEPNDDMAREEKFIKVMNQSKLVSIETKEIEKAADEKTAEIIEKTTTTITSLKQEVNQLKQDLNEANEKLDSVINVNVELGRKFKLRPIPDNEENR